MTDPFDVLRQRSPSPAPDADYVARVMSEVARRLDAPQQQQQATPIPTKSEFLEIIPMHRSSPRRRPMVVAISAVAAAAALVAVVLLRDDPSSTPSRPATTPPAVTAATTPVASASAALIGSWMSGTRSYLASGAGVSLKIDNNSLSLAVSNLSQAPSLSGDVRTIGEGTFVVSTRSTSTTSISCASTAKGTYTWKVSASGRQLEISAQSDECAERSAALVGSYWHMGCVDTHNLCLGLLDPGTYASQFIRPFQTTVSGWSPRYAGVRYTVPDGWANFADFPDNFGLSPEKDFASTTAAQTTPTHSIAIFSPVAPVTGACETPKPVLSTSLEGAVAALSATPGITVSAPTSMTVDGHRAMAVDVARSATICPNGSANVLLGGSLTDSTSTVFLDPNEKARVILVDLRDGATGENGIQLASIWIDALNGDGLDAFIPEAMKIIDTMHFS